MKFKKIVILTGAGVSAESGVKTFRDHGGLWEKYAIEDVATPNAFKRNSDLVYRFYNERRLGLKNVLPNPAHQALAQFEKSFDGRFLLVTQNVDDLHERAGSQNLLHMHGELLKARCLACGQIHLTDQEFDETSSCPACQQIGKLRPHIVWFGEIPFYMGEIHRHLNDCDLFVSIGTSGVVYPAAMFVQQCPKSALKVEINLENADNSKFFDEHLIGAASVEVPNFFQSLKGKSSPIS